MSTEKGKEIGNHKLTASGKLVPATGSCNEAFKKQNMI